MSNQTEWRWADPTGQQRLVREDDLRKALESGVIPANAPVWTRGWTGWKPAHDVPELTGKAAAPTNGDVPPPPNFIVAAQDAFEGKAKPVPTGPAEPPPPPRYVPLAPQTQPQVPPALGSDTKVDAPKVAPVPAPGPPRTITKPSMTATKPVASKPPPLPTSKQPPPLPAKTQRKSSAPPPLPPAAKKKSIAPPPPAPAQPIAKSPPAHLARTAPSPGNVRSVYKETQRPPAGVAPPSVELPPISQSRQTLQIAPAPPPMPRLDPLPVAPAPVPAPAPVYEPPKEPSSKFPTLMMFGEDTVPNAGPPVASHEEAPPIVVPPPEPSSVTHAVTRPPPWGEGAVGIDIPKSPRVPGTRDSEAPRPMELSSSDLTSEARIEVVKAQPLIAAERPRTMAGLGPDMLAQNRAALDKAQQSPPPAPLSQSDVAATTRRTAIKEEEARTDSSVPPPRVEPFAPAPRASGAKLHDLQQLARERAERAQDAARRAYADLRERTKDKPPWFLPVIAGGSAFVVLILLVAGVKAAFGTSSSGSSVASSSASTSSSAIAQSSGTGESILPAPKMPTRPMTCKAAGAPHDVAPKALIGSGVEVAAIGGQFALGFAVAPKEATLEVLDATSLASASALHLRSNDPVRRVLALDTSKAAVDSDHKGDKLQGRRTLRASPPIDVGAMDGGIAWAPHGTEKGVKLWSLADAEAPVEALRGEALPNGGFAIAFRQAGAIHFGAFGGNPPAPLGALGHAQGLGPQIGSPAVAVSGDHVMVAWADRVASTDPWGIRYVAFKVGEENVQAKSFSLPPGGLGEQAMSPGLTTLGAGRFLLVWTEGPVSSHQVRGIAFGESGPVGDAFTASTEGMNAGQGQAAVAEGGRGVVAFLASSGKSFEVRAAPIQCAEK